MTERKNLFTLLNDANMLDELGEEVEVVWSEVKQKVDYIYDLCSRWEYEAKRQKDIAKEFMQAAKVLENKRARLLAYVENAMIANNATKLPGERFSISVGMRTAYKYPEHEPVQDDLKEHPNYVRQKLEWNKVALKEAFKAGQEKELVSEFKKPSLRLGVKK